MATASQLEGIGAISDREAFEDGFTAPLEGQDHAGANMEAQDPRGNRCHSKGSVSPRATIRQLEGTGDILEREAILMRLYTTIGG